MSKQFYQHSSGNVYKDLEFPNAEEMQAKAMLASSILSVIEKKKWTQDEAAKILGIKQPKVSLLCRGKFSGFSMEKLIKLLNKLNQDIEIVIKEKPFSTKHTGHVSVIHAYQ
jgi:predicted XRE-type DNA-binding protein